MNRTQLQQLNPEHILFKYQKLQLKLDEQKKEFQKEKEKENEVSFDLFHWIVEKDTYNFFFFSSMLSLFLSRFILFVWI